MASVICLMFSIVQCEDIPEHDIMSCVNCVNFSQFMNHRVT